MWTVRTLALMLALWALVPSMVWAQASIAGVVRDTSGAVLPGVTVDAASPALIEKVRSAATDSSGQFQIVELRPGTYSVSFTLPGFNTVKRDGVELSGSFTATIDVEMRVGALEETITVTAETPTVDVQNATKQQVLTHQIIDALPTNRSYNTLGVLITGVNASAVDAGGTNGDAFSTNLTAHGSKGGDMRIQNNGITNGSLQSAGSVSQSLPNISAAQEVTIDTGAGTADAPTGGVRVNLIPRDGGNLFTGFMLGNFANDAMQGSNHTQRLKDRGVQTVDSIKESWDFSPGFGGPIARDRAWFYFTGRYNGTNNYIGGMFENRNANNPNAWTFDPDVSQPAINYTTWVDAQLRVTIQATPRNKIAATWDQQGRFSPQFFTSATRAPESGNDRRSDRQQWKHVEWTSPATNRLLLEAVVTHRGYRWGNYEPAKKLYLSATPPGMIAVTEQTTGLVYRGQQGGSVIGAGNLSQSTVPNWQWRAAASYVTGSHALKVGVGDIFGYNKQEFYTYPPISYRFNNGVPNLVNLWAMPITTYTELHHDFGAFIQDKWTRSRLTLTGGLRFDWVAAGVPEQKIGPAPLAPNRNITFPADRYTNWQDLSPRVAGVYDLFGTSKTAVKASLGRFLAGMGLNNLGGFPTNPASNLVLTTSRPWTDLNRDFVVDCELLNPVANGECTGPLGNPNFGGVQPGATFDEHLLTGWGTRNYNWEFSTGIQHEILPRLSAEVAFFRRWYGNFEVVDNLAVESSDYDRFSITAPGTDPRLPTAGQALPGFFAITPAKVAVPTRNFHTSSDNYGRQIEHWNGVDLTLNARLLNGVTVQGGLATGKTTTDNCEIVAKVPELLFGGAALAGANASSWMPAQFCHQESPFLTQYKLFGSYVLPRVDVQVSGTFQSTPGPLLLANFNAPNAAVTPSLGRPLAGGAPNITLQLVEPGSMYGERLNQIDLRIGKLFRIGDRRRVTVNFDIYNALNVDTIVQVNNAFAAWQRPTTLTQARFLKVGGQIDF